MIARTDHYISKRNKKRRDSINQMDYENNPNSFTFLMKAVQHVINVLTSLSHSVNYK